MCAILRNKSAEYLCYIIAYDYKEYNDPIKQ